ncbi:uncharacterized protein K02A2.6-like [Malaya genurostris]|uniref:uncharacterized protein K02A2.6-like n=1 Tax=Malaya genurostris TaxID=325434 RepID=UPI0026F3DF09|nr:uncharacterized protein K02A2.6-like [Malaya genurostris]
MEKPSLQPFDISDTSSIGTRWRKWKRSLDLFLDVSCIALPSRKKAYLLHYAGQEVQDIFYDTEGNDNPPPPGSDVHKEAIRILDEHFAPFASVPYDRFLFRSIKQQDAETVEKFTARLREQGRLCEYGAALDMRITEQIFDNCRSEELREVILRKKLMTVADILEQARIIETVQRNREQMKSPNVVNDTEVNLARISKKDVCYRCGNTGHFASDKRCPAKDKTCDRCNIVGHFHKMCKTKPETRRSMMKKHKKKIWQIRDNSDESSPVEDSECETDVEGSETDVQQINTTGVSHDKVTCYIGGVKLDWIVDSGAHVNVISRKTWSLLKNRGCTANNRPNPRKFLRVYGNGKLRVHKVIKTDIATRSKSVNHKVYVVDLEDGANLLCKNTSIALGILEIHGEVFSVSNGELPVGKVKNLQVEIKINDKVTPVQQPCRRLPIPLQSLVQDKLDDLLKQDIIEPAPLKITWASPLVVTPKDGGRNVRLCIDMRQANKAIIPERHPLPTFEEIMPHLEGAKIFSKIDLIKAFHQIELAPASREITTFVTPNAYYRYKRLMFGMSCAAEIFQREIERILKGLPGTKVFIDDILVFGATKDEHDRRVLAVMTRLKKHGLTVNMEKCEIGQHSVNFMGHTLSESGILPMNDKISAIKSFRRPRNAVEMRSFLGLANYVGRFIPNLSTISSPLREMTLKGSKFRWTDESEQSFDRIKTALSNPKHLGYYSPTYPTTLITDASDCGLGAVLLQTINKMPRVISYASKSLSATEKKYSTLDKEALAIVWAAERFQMYLKGLEFIIMTDHKPLLNIFNEKSTPNQRQEWWILRMQSFRYKITHVPGKINIADPLSRLSEVLRENTFDRRTEKELYSIVQINKPPAVTMNEMIMYSQDDKEIQEVKRALHNDIWNDVKRYMPFKSELCFAGEVLLRKNRVVVPSNLRETVLSLAHCGHPGREKMKRRLRVAVWWPGIDAQAEQKCKECFDCQLVAPFDKPEPMRIRELPSAPWVHLAGDFLGPLPNGNYLFVLIDLYSRYVLAEPMKRTTSSDVIRVLKQNFTKLGLPYALTFDNAKNFSSQELKDYCVDRGIKLLHTTPYWPSANGEVERQNRSFLKVLKISRQQGTDWKEALQEYLYMYAVTPHSVTGVSPAQLMFGRRFRDVIPHVHDAWDDGELRDRDLLAKCHAKEIRDKRVGAKESTVTVGDTVLMKNTTLQDKLASKFLPTPAKIVSRCSNSLTLETPDGQSYKRNTSHVKPFVNTAKQRETRYGVTEITQPDNQSVAASTKNNILTPVRQSVQEEKVQGKIELRPRREVRAPKWFNDYTP